MLHSEDMQLMDIARDILLLKAAGNDTELDKVDDAAATAAGLPPCQVGKAKGPAGKPTGGRGQ